MAKVLNKPKEIKKPIFASFGKTDWTSLGKSFNLATGLGFSISIPIVLGTILGLFLDTRLGTKPFFTLGFLTLGIIASIYGTIKFIKENL